MFTQKAAIQYGHGVSGGGGGVYSWMSNNGKEVSASYQAVMWVWVKRW